MNGISKWLAPVIVLAVAGLAAGVVDAQSIGEMAKSGAEDLGKIPDLIEVVLYLSGVVLVGSGIVKFKRFNDAPKSQRLGGAFATLLVGAALLALPAVYNGISKTFGMNAPETVGAPQLD